MIARISGEIIVKRPPFLIIDVGGVGYELQAPMSTFYKLPEVGERTTVLTHFIVREDAQSLYAFLSEYDRRLFRELLRVSGIGAKIALAVLSSMDAGTFKECILNKDVDFITRVPGIGTKTAERLIVEMKNRFEDAFWRQLEAADPDAATNDNERHTAEAVQALITLGYKASDAKRLVKAVSTEQTDTEEIIRQALKASLKPR